MPENVEENLTTALPPTPPVNDTNAKKHAHKPFSKLPLAEQLLIAKRALENTANNPQINSVMVNFGYDHDKLSKFRKLLEEAIHANSMQSKEYGERAEAYADFNKFLSIAKVEFSNLRKFLRVALKHDPEKLVQLKADDRKKQTVSGLLGQMQTCYENIFTDREVLQSLAQIGISENILMNFKANFDATNNAYVIFFKEDSEAVNATRIRDQRVEDLCDFLQDFFVLAKIAFADQPDLLSQIS